MNKIYLITGYCDTDNGRITWPVKAFASERDAIKFGHKIESWLYAHVFDNPHKLPMSEDFNYSKYPNVNTFELYGYYLDEVEFDGSSAPAT